MMCPVVVALAVAIAIAAAAAAAANTSACPAGQPPEALFVAAIDILAAKCDKLLESL